MCVYNKTAGGVGYLGGIIIIIIGGGFSDISGLLSAMLHRVFYQTPGIHVVMYCFTLAL